MEKADFQVGARGDFKFARTHPGAELLPAVRREARDGWAMKTGEQIAAADATNMSINATCRSDGLSGANDGGSARFWPSCFLGEVGPHRA